MAEHPKIAQLEVIGQSGLGKDINAVRVTGNVARTHPDGRRPTTVYMGAQHAREWITPDVSYLTEVCHLFRMFEVVKLDFRPGSYSGRQQRP